MGMEMKNAALPYAAMVFVQFVQVGHLVAAKAAISSGVNNFIYVFYSSAIAFLILLPSSFLIHRSNRPPLTPSLFSGFLLLGILGFSMQVFGYAGIRFASANLASSMLTLIPGFTFILAIIFRMEKVDFRSSSTIAKTAGTLVSVIGALIVVLYNGPTIITNLSFSNHVTSPFPNPSDWIIGGFFLLITCIISSVFIITQTLVLKKYPDELTVMSVYSFTVAILSAITSLTVEKDLTAWSLRPNIRLYAVLYSGLFGASFQVTMGGWCVKKRGPLFVSMFHPMGIVISTIVGVLFLSDAFYFGSLLGSIVIIIGFYYVMWGKAKEEKIVEKLGNENAPLLG